MEARQGAGQEAEDEGAQGKNCGHDLGVGEVVCEEGEAECSSAVEPGSKHLVDIWVW